MDRIVAADVEEVKSVVKGNFFGGKKVLVSGGAGFIGSWVCDVLLGFGCEVTVVDDFSTGQRKNIEHHMGNPCFSFVEQKVQCFSSEAGFDLIFHLAAHASPDEYVVHPIETLQTSAWGTQRIVEIARKCDATLLFASTSEVYGDAEVIPTPETYWGKVNPMMKVNVLLKPCLWRTIKSIVWMCGCLGFLIRMVRVFVKTACMVGLFLGLFFRQLIISL